MRRGSSGPARAPPGQRRLFPAASSILSRTRTTHAEGVSFLVSSAAGMKAQLRGHRLPRFVVGFVSGANGRHTAGRGVEAA